MSEPITTNAEPRDLEAERRVRKQRLAASFRLFARYGLDEGLLGHITVRDPEHPDQFWVNPMAMHFGMIRASDLLRVDPQGEVVEGDGVANFAAFAIHSAIHVARPDVMAAAHAHTLYGKSFASLGRLLDPLTQEACMFYDDHALYEDYSGVVQQPEEGKRIAETLGSRKAVILQNHGLLTVGASLEAAVWFFISMDRCCRAQLLAEHAGTPKHIGAEIASQTRDFTSSDFAAKLNFQPLYDMIVREQPDLLE